MAVGFHQRDCCPLCESTSSRVLCEIPYHDQRLATFIGQFYQGRAPLESLASGNYRVVVCTNCDFIYQDPVLNEAGMKALYVNWIDQVQSLQKKQTAKSRLYRQYAGQIHTLSRLFNRRPDQIRVLDFGMGWGYWSRMAQAHGLNVVGYELSAQRVEHARKMGVTVIDDLSTVEDDFDFIYANQVFEHLSNPVQIMQTLCQCLKPTGFIYIRVPDGRGVARSLAQRGWTPDLDAIHPLEHINCFTRKTLIDLGARAGLKPFSPPLRLSWDGLWGGIRREIVDRWFTTHIFFSRRD
ncbi:MAG: class I SAM-dependent methyltransferase [Gammaproteobacteria bacterium]|nr:class I SAM-dependent methyltransferase [Gammaproteobacteria bacterium]